MDQYFEVLGGRRRVARQHRVPRNCRRSPFFCASRAPRWETPMLAEARKRRAHPDGCAQTDDLSGVPAACAGLPPDFECALPSPRWSRGRGRTTCARDYSCCGLRQLLEPHARKWQKRMCMRVHGCGQDFKSVEGRGRPAQRVGGRAQPSSDFSRVLPRPPPAGAILRRSAADGHRRHQHHQQLC
jgi:hypothetical protein